MQRSEKYMRLALDEARKAEDRTYPNPMVGAVIVRSGRVIGRGYHKKAGSDHAEIAAIKNSKNNVRGSEIYVTLEPCDHYGRTPPCTDKIIESGIRKVHIAMTDPNPLTKGRGIRKLRKAGLLVTTGLLADEARSLNRKYIKCMTTGLPYVTVKLAQSLDGKIAARDGSSKWITSARTRGYVKKMRMNFNAVVVGANTACQDDPFLLGPGKRGYATARVVVDSTLRIPFSANLIKTSHKAPVIIVTTERALPRKVERFRKISGVDVIVTKSRGGRVPLKYFLKELGRRGIVNVLIEGGGSLAGALLAEKLIDEWMFFIAPKILGGSCDSVKWKGAESIKKAVELKDIRVESFGEDILIRGRACSPE